MTSYQKLEQFGFLKVTGVDAVSFLQGYTTCDLENLDSEKASLGALCNIQGRMVSSFLLVKDGQDLILRMHRGLIAPTITFLEKYIVFSKASLEDISDSLVCYGSPEAAPYLKVSTSDSGFRIGLENRHELWQKEIPEISDATPADWNDLEIEAGIAWVSTETADSYLPQMFAYHQLAGIDFEKGCYLGQEIVARAHYRGQLKRRLHRIEQGGLETGPLPDDQGEIVSAGTMTALAVLRNASEDPVEVTLPDGSTLNAVPV